MTAATITPTLFDALTRAGIKPEEARQIEHGIVLVINASQDDVRTEMREHYVSKTEGSNMEPKLIGEIRDVEKRLSGEIRDIEKRFSGELHSTETRLLEAIRKQGWDMMRLILVANGLLFALLKMWPS